MSRAWFRGVVARVAERHPDPRVVCGRNYDANDCLKERSLTVAALLRYVVC
jgi:hypothetical protein